MIKLRKYQLNALDKMRNGCVLCGDTGSGKSMTAVAYYYLLNGGKKESLMGGEYSYMRKNPIDLYIITTARKRDTFEWEMELAPFLITGCDDKFYRHTVIIDSWNNIAK